MHLVRFITSEGFLVIAGRDAIQNDMLYKRYLEKVFQSLFFL
jgi:predicted ribosome quality control (RQC) complex YloA/Tae2 family protein